MVTSEGPSMMPLGSELVSQTICTFQILSMIGLGSMVMSFRRYLRMPLNLLENQ